MEKPILTDTQEKKKKKGICVNRCCMKKAAKGRSHCCSCRLKVVIQNDPVKYTFFVKRNNAKRKGKYFNLSLSFFRTLCDKIDYMRKKGTSAKSMTIDRIKECIPGCPRFCKDHGYHEGNVQGLTLRENIHKYKNHKKNFPDVPF